MTTSTKINAARKEMFFSELHSLLVSGIDFSRAFRLLISSQQNDSMRSLLQNIFDRVVAGASLAAAMQSSGQFSALDCGVVRIGEETGRLDETLDFLSNYYHKRIEQRRMILSAVSYPAIIIVTAIVVVIFMMMVVVPMFEQVYQRMGGELPWLTRQIIAFSSTFGTVMAVVGVLVVVLSALAYLNRNNELYKKYSAELLLRLPLFGYAVRKSAQANFCKLLFMLTSSGVPLIRSLALMRDIVSLYPYRHSFDAIASGIERGESFAANLEKYPALYDVKLKTLLMVGEETNRLPAMLRKQGDDITLELEYRLKQLGSTLEPLLILFVGTIVATILVAMYLPMFKLGGVIG